jgi:hypothetical protein
VDFPREDMAEGPERTGMGRHPLESLRDDWEEVKSNLVKHNQTMFNTLSFPPWHLKKGFISY